MSVSKLRVLALVHRHLIPPDKIEEGTDIIVGAVADRVRRHLDAARAWATKCRRSASTTTSARSAALATEWKPHIAFNLLEGFDDITIFDQNVVCHLELLKLPYTGLQSARAAARARQVAVEEAARLPPHPGAGVRGVPHRPADPPAQAAARFR